MTDRYAVVGNPIAHSKSPAIHTLFARETCQDIEYSTLLAPLDGFVEAVLGFRDGGGRGLNVTVPFKQDAFRLATRHTERAYAAGAVNTLSFDGAEIVGDTTDGAGLLRDLEINRGLNLAGKRVLLLGAGGAARSVVLPLLQAGPAELVIANRTPDRAVELAARFSDTGNVRGGGWGEVGPEAYDLVVNATAASLGGEVPPLPASVFTSGSFAYDMMYGETLTPFLSFARSMGVARVADGLGMLVEQAAESFFIWRGIRPTTPSVIASLRA